MTCRRFRANSSDNTKLKTDSAECIPQRRWLKTRQPYMAHSEPQPTYTGTPSAHRHRQEVKRLNCIQDQSGSMMESLFINWRGTNLTPTNKLLSNL